MGRPPEPVPEDKAQFILNGLCEGRTLTSLCDELGMDFSTVTKWKQKDETFRQEFARAREYGAEAIYDQAQDIVDRATPENVQVAKLQAETRQKRAACFCPRVFGTKQAIEHSGRLSLDAIIGETLAKHAAEKPAE